MLIVFEGIDGGGKGTQIDLLCKRLECRKQTYPDRVGIFGEIFNKVLKGKMGVEMSGAELFPMFLMDMLKDKRMFETYKGSKEKHIVVDRYCHSTLAYQSAQGADYERGRKIIEGFGLVRPDIVVLLDITPEESMRRIPQEREIFEREEFLTKVRENYMRIWKDGFFAERIVIIDGMGTVEEVSRRIQKETGV